MTGRASTSTYVIDTGNGEKVEVPGVASVVHDEATSTLRLLDGEGGIIATFRAYVSAYPVA